MVQMWTVKWLKGNEMKFSMHLDEESALQKYWFVKSSASFWHSDGIENRLLFYKVLEHGVTTNYDGIDGEGLEAI